MKTELINFDNGEICSFCFDAIKDAHTHCAPPCSHLFCKERSEPVHLRMHHVIPDDPDVPDDPEGECAERVCICQNVQSFFVGLERVMFKAMFGAAVLLSLGVPSPAASILMAAVFGMGQQPTP